MSSSLLNLLDVIEAKLADVAPPTRPENRYRHVTGQEKSIGASADRCFWFNYPTSMSNVAEAGVDMSEVEWSFELGLRLVCDESLRDNVKRVANEAVLVLRTITKISALGDGVSELVVDGAPSIEKSDNSITIKFALRALTQETD